MDRADKLSPARASTSEAGRYSTDDAPKLVANIPVGALPHGVWPSNDGSRIYVGLLNGDAVEIIDMATNKVIGRVPVGHAPQALVYVSGAAPDAAGSASLAPLANKASTCD